MSTATLQQVLDAVRRHLQRTRRLVAARHAAWGSALVMLAGLLVHLFVRPLAFGGLFAAALVPWLLAFAQSVITRPRPAECADWADRHLGGRSAYATALEHAAGAHGARPSARAHLEAWIAAAAPHSLALLAAQPRDLRLRRPVLVALVCTALAAGMLQLPTRPLAGTATGVALESVRASVATVDSSGTTRESPTRTSAPGKRDDRGDDRVAAHQDAALATPSAPTAPNESGENTAAGRDGAPTGIESSSGGSGREAGSSRDSSADATPTSAWTGALAARLRQVTSGKESESTTADANRAVEYTTAAATHGRSPAMPQSVAAATPPPADDELRVGPAERAYLRAYWAANGARP